MIDKKLEYYNVLCPSVGLNQQLWNYSPCCLVDIEMKMVQPQVLDTAPTFQIMRKRLEALDEDNNTPLHYATRYSHFPAIRLLVERGADVNSAGEDQARPLHFLARYQRAARRRSSVGLLRKRTRSLDYLDELIELSSARPDSAKKTSIVTRKASGERRSSADRGKTRNRSGGSVRMKSMAKKSQNSEEDPGDLDIVQFFVSNGADVNVPDLYGMTPLHHCGMRQNRSLAFQLIACPAIKIDARSRLLSYSFFISSLQYWCLTRP